MKSPTAKVKTDDGKSNCKPSLRKNSESEKAVCENPLSKKADGEKLQCKNMSHRFRKVENCTPRSKLNHIRLISYGKISDEKKTTKKVSR